MKKYEAIRNFNIGNSKIAGSHTYGYHSLARKDMSNGCKWKVGIEIEKIHKLNNSVSGDKLFKLSKHIIKETDSSLGPNGNEYVTGVLPLHDLGRTMSFLEPIKHIINLPFTSKADYMRAGGHINVSEKGKTGMELARELKVYMPLLYALYPGRAFKQNYSTADTFEKLTSNTGKRAIFPKQRLLELRIFPAIDDWDDLRVRLELVQYMLRHKYKRYSSIIVHLNNPESELNTIIGKLNIKNKDKILRRYIVFSRLDDAKLTKEAKEIIESKNIEVEAKFTAKAVNVPRHLTGVYIELNEKVV